MAHLRVPPITFASRWKRTLGSGLAWIVIGPIAAMAGEPARSPSHLVPARDLSFLFEYDGLDAHADAWKGTAAYKILDETPAGAILSQSAQKALGALFAPLPRGPLSGADVIAVQGHLTHRGFSVASFGDGSTVFAINDLGEKATRDRFENVIRLLLQLDAGDKLSTSIRARDRDIFEFQPCEKPEAVVPLNMPRAGPTWWFEGGTLIVVKAASAKIGEVVNDPEQSRKDLAAKHKARVDAVLDAIEGKLPNASTHPAYIAARAEGNDLDGFEPNGLFLVESLDGKGVVDGLQDRAGDLLGEWEPTLDEFSLARLIGVNRATRIVGRWGFRGKALLSDTRFEGPGPWRGFVGMAGEAGFRKDRLPPIPAGMEPFVVGAIGKGLDSASLRMLRGVLKPEYRPYVEAVEDASEDAIPRELRDELRRHLGPTWSVYTARGIGDEKQTLPAFLIGVDDVVAFDKGLEAAASKINTYLREQEGRKDGAPALAFERLPAPERGYRLVSPDGSVGWLTDQVRPTILLGESFVACAPNPALARSAIAAESRGENRWAPTGETAKIFECLPRDLALLSLGDPRDSFWPEMLATLPETATSFLGKLVDVDLGEASNDRKPPNLLSLLGLKRADEMPANRGRLRPDDVRSLLFPSVFAATASEQGVRFLRAEALPFACLGFQYSDEQRGRSRHVEFKLKFAPGR